VVVIRVVNMTMFFIEVFSVVMSLNIVVMLHYLATMVLMVAAMVRIQVFEAKVHLGALLEGRLGYQVTVGTLVIAVVEITNDCHHGVSSFLSL